MAGMNVTEPCRIDSRTEALIRSTVERFVAEEKSFFATDITNAVKAQGGVGRHAEIADRAARIIRHHLGLQLTESLVPVLGGRAMAVLYHPRSNPPLPGQLHDLTSARRQTDPPPPMRHYSAGRRAAAALADLE